MSGFGAPVAMAGDIPAGTCARCRCDAWVPPEPDYFYQAAQPCTCEEDDEAAREAAEDVPHG